MYGDANQGTKMILCLFYYSCVNLETNFLLLERNCTKYLLQSFTKMEKLNQINHVKIKMIETYKVRYEN